MNFINDGFAFHVMKMFQFMYNISKSYFRMNMTGKFDRKFNKIEKWQNILI